MYGWTHKYVFLFIGFYLSLMGQTIVSTKTLFVNLPSKKAEPSHTAVCSGIISSSHGLTLLQQLLPIERSCSSF
jgi:hypothetical protein